LYSGPGTYTLTSLALSLSRTSPTGPSKVDIRVQVFRADAVTGVPLSGIALTQDNDVELNVAPSYIPLALSELLVDTAGALGTHYALVLSFSAPADWHSIEDFGQPDGLPDLGIASVYGSWVRSASAILYVRVRRFGAQCLSV
jgi:hypothetical protein